METIAFRTKIKNGVIQIPARFIAQVSEDVQVILIPKREKPTENNLIAELMEHPLKLTGFKPLSRDDAHARK